MQKDILEKFWEQVAEDLAKEYGGHHPRNWTESDIRRFNSTFVTRLTKAFREDRNKVRLCGLAWEDRQFKDFHAPDNGTFRRIFQKKTSRSNVSKRNQFAIYLGYDSFEDFVLKRNIKPIIDLQKNTRESPLIPATTSNISTSKISTKTSIIAFLSMFLIFLIIYFFCPDQSSNQKQITPLNEVITVPEIIEKDSFYQDTIDSSPSVQHKKSTKITTTPSPKITPIADLKSWTIKGQIKPFDSTEVLTATIWVEGIGHKIQSSGRFEIIRKDPIANRHHIIILKAQLGSWEQTKQINLFNENEITFFKN